MYRLKRFIRDHERIMLFLSSIYRISGRNYIIGRRGLKIMRGGVFASKVKILNRGNNNVIQIDKGCRMSNCCIRIFGNGNRIHISHDCVCKEMDIWISDGSVLTVGHNTHFAGKIHLACIEGKTISIGERCLFSNGITFRTGDSHVITDAEDNRINFGRDITIGDHVWIGHQVTVLKGATIGSDSIVGTGSLLTNKTFPGNVLLGGSPAKILKENVNWRPK